MILRHTNRRCKWMKPTSSVVRYASLHSSSRIITGKLIPSVVRWHLILIKYFDDGQEGRIAPFYVVPPKVATIVQCHLLLPYQNLLYVDPINILIDAGSDWVLLDIYHAMPSQSKRSGLVVLLRCLSVRSWSALTLHLKNWPLRSQHLMRTLNRLLAFFFAKMLPFISNLLLFWLQPFVKLFVNC